LVPGAVAAARTLAQVKKDPPNFSELLVAIAKNESNPTDLRLDALAALPKGANSVDPALFDFLRANVDSSKPVAIRVAASGTLSRAQLSDEQLINLSDTTEKAGPLELPRLVGAFEQSTNEAVGMKLMVSLKKSKSLSSLRPDLLKTTCVKYPGSVQEKATELLSVMNVNWEKQNAHLNELLGSLKPGDVRRGQTIFNSPKAACYSCHKLMG